MSTHPYYPANSVRSSHYTQLAMLMVSGSQRKYLSREDEEKRRVRRERNKVAATKCREKRKAHSVNVRREYAQVTAAGRTLDEEINALKRQRSDLTKTLESHVCHLIKHQQQPRLIQQHQRMGPPNQCNGSDSQHNLRQ